MAQFKRNLFNTSYFGKSYSFVGEYFTRIIDVGEKFTGNINVEIKLNLPLVTYRPEDGEFYTINPSWRISNNLLKTSTNSPLEMFFCADILEFNFNTDSLATVDIIIKNDENQIVNTTTLNTSENKTSRIELPYGNKWVSIVNKTPGQLVSFKEAKVRAASVLAEIFTGDTYISQDPSTVPNRLPINFGTILRPDQDGIIRGTTTSPATNQEAVGVKIALSSSDNRQSSSPVIDSIKLSSGDITRYTNRGSWQAAINMNNVAQHSDKTFKKTKRLVFETEGKEDVINNNLNWMENYLEIRTASKDLTAAGDSTIPTDAEVRGAYFWTPETATYRKYKNVVVPRISLKTKGVNNNSETKEYANLLFGPISKTSFPMINITIRNWIKFMMAYSLPTDKNSTYFKVQVFNTKEINTHLPVFEKAITGNTTNPEIPIELASKYDTIYVGLVFYSTPATQTPVIDLFNIEANVDFSVIKNYSEEVSPFDGTRGSARYDNAPRGTKRILNIHSNDFEFPSQAENKRFKLHYKLKYPTQQNIYFGESDGTALSSDEIKNREIVTVFNTLTPEEPAASTLEVPGDKLSWHYQYDGGTVSFPHKLKKEVSTQFTPSLQSGKTYKFFVYNGWPNDTFNVPYTMSWSDIAEITGESEEKLKEINKNIMTYNNKVQKETVIDLPNDTANPNIRVSFESDKEGNFTKKSLWNNNESNNKVIGEIVTNSQDIVPWKSEERIFAGIINPNNEQGSYIRTQSLGNGVNTNSISTKNTKNQAVSYLEMAKEKNISLADLLLANNLLSEYGRANEIMILPNEDFLIPASPSLPDVPGNIFYEGDNPYVVEIIPGTIVKSFDGIVLEDNALTAGSDDEDAIQYTLVESEEKEHILTRGSFLHGVDALPYSNVSQVISIRNNKTGVTYSKYNKTGTNETGDYYLDNGMINWAPKHAQSKEPAAGEQYTVKFKNSVVDKLKITYTSDYKEKLSYNKLWRSSEIKEFEQIVTPEKNKIFNAPNPNTFDGYNENIKNIDYIIQDSDLWVTSSLFKDEEENKMIKLSMEGKDPKRNWHPTINKGFYYINDEERYLYSEMISYKFKEDVVPVIKDVTYTGSGLTMNEEVKTEAVRNPIFSNFAEGWTLREDAEVVADNKKGFIVKMFNLQEEQQNEGSRNYFKGYTEDEEITAPEYFGIHSYLKIDDKVSVDMSQYKDEYFTITFEAMTTGANGTIKVYNSNMDTKFFNFEHPFTEQVTNEWKTFSATIINDEKTEKGNKFINSLQFFINDSIGVKIRNIRINKGQYDRGFSLAPEDMVVTDRVRGEITKFLQNPIIRIEAKSIDNSNLQVKIGDSVIEAIPLTNEWNIYEIISEGSYGQNTPISFDVSNSGEVSKISILY